MIDWSSAIGSGVSGIMSLGGNLITSAVNSGRAFKYTKMAMQLQDELNRKYATDSYSLMRQGLKNAGYNPLLALGSSANSAIYNASGPNADSDAGSQAVTSAIDARRQVDEHRINKQTEQKIKNEAEHIDLQNQKLRSEITTSPRKVISDIITGSNNPVIQVIKKFAKKAGINIPDNNSAVDSSNNKTVIKLHDGKPYVQKGVPRSVVRKFVGSNSNSAVTASKKDSIVSSWNNSSHKYHVHYLPDNYNSKRVNRKYNFPPKTQIK